MSQDTHRNRIVPVVIGLLAILAIGMGAATLDSARTIGGDDGNKIIDPPDPGGPELNNSDVNETAGNAAGSVSGASGLGIKLSFCVPFLASTPGIGLVVLAYLSIVGIIYYRYNFSAALLGSWTLLPPVLMVYLLLTNCSTSGSGSSALGGSAGALTGDSPVGIDQVPPWMMGSIVVGILVVAIGLLYWSSSEEEEIAPQKEENTDDDPELDRFAEAAGRAADRIEDHNAAVDNAVYRAWLDMTSFLDVENRELYSPTDFATRAINLGMDEKYVNELTHLFNEVRYGGKNPHTRGDRAVSVLRNIESEYGGDSGTSGRSNYSEEGKR